jgi:sentrin-specific protease 7
LAIIVSPINAFRSVDVSAGGLPTASIIVLDSLQSTKHYKTTCIIKNYLINEWTDKGNQLEDTTIIDRALFRGIYPKNVPQQDNYWDCGVFLLQYAELFLTQPPLSVD